MQIHNYGKVALKVHKVVPRGGVFAYNFCPGAVILHRFSVLGTVN